jgi:hypothetical protein
MFKHLDRFENRPLLAATAPAAGTRPNPAWCLSGTNGADANVTAKNTGGWQIDTAGAASDSMIVSPHSAAGVSKLYATVYQSDRGQRARFVFGGDTTANQRFEVGIRPTLTAFDDATDNEKVIVRSVDGGNLYLVTSNGGTDATEDLGVSWDADRLYVVDLIVSIGTAPRVTCAVGGRVVNTPSSHTLAAAATLGLPYFGIKDTAGAVKGFVLVEVAIMQALDL